MQPYQLKIEKPWGYELIFTPSETSVVAKLIHLNAGARFSLQYHEIKEETLILVSGQANIILGENKEILTKNEMVLNFGYLITPKLIHRCEAISDCDILEASTKEKGVTVRLEDDYSRGNETEEERLKYACQK